MSATVKQASLLDLVDLKETKQCKINFRGYSDVIITCLVKKLDGTLAVMLAGGQLLKVTQEEFNMLEKCLDKHLKKHMYHKS